MSEQEAKRSRVREMFDAISPRYDLLNRVLSFGRDRSWRRRAVSLLAPRQGGTMIDVAAGTGDVALAAAKRHPHLGRIVITDFSEGMLAPARRKTAGRHRRPAFFVAAADAVALPFADDSADAVTIAFGIRNVVDVPAALAEMHRVLRRGGRVVLLEFAVPRGRVFGPLFRWYFMNVLPRLGGLVSGSREAYEYLPRSVDEFHTPREITGLLREAGFQPATLEAYTFGVAVAILGIKE